MNLRTASLCVLTAAVLCCPYALGQEQDYPSTTMVYASVVNGDIQAYSAVSWSGDCYDDALAGTSFLYLDNYGQVYVTGSDDGAQFRTEEDFGLIFGPGTYAVEGSFTGFGANDQDCEVDGSSGDGGVTIPAVASVLAVTPSPATVPEGQKLVVTASVSGVTGYNSGPNPTGSVILFYGSTILASSSIKPVANTNLNPIASAATFNLPTTGVAPGNYALSIAYSGDSNLQGSSTPLQVTVTAPKVATTTTVSISPNVVTVGNSVTLTATVTSSGVTPTGTVTFLVGTTSIGTAKLNSSGVATLTDSTSGIPPGTYAVHASYGGDAYNNASVSSAQNITVQAATATTLSANPTTVTEGQTVNLTAKVARTAGSGMPTGTVAFQFGGYTLATSTLSSGTATASISTKNLSPGSYPLTAVYNGDTLDTGSTSSAVMITVQ